MAEASVRREGSPSALLWLMAVLAALVVGAVLLWSQDTRRGTLAPDYSVYRADDRGAALAYRLLERSGYRPQVWDRELGQLLRDPRRPRGVLLLVAPARGRGSGPLVESSAGDILPGEVRALDEWVAAGNVAVLFSRARNELFDALGLLADEPNSVASQSAEPSQPSRLALGVRTLVTQAQFGFKFSSHPGASSAAASPPGASEEAPPVEPSPIAPIPAEQWVTLFSRREEQREYSHVVTAVRGKGLYVAVNDPYPLTNLGVLQGDNARFVVNLAGYLPPGGTMWFDEYHKRSVQRGLVSYLRDRALLPPLLYGLVLLALLFWRTGTRFGTAAPLVADERRDSTEYVRAVAALYRNAGMSHQALSILYADFRRRLAGALRLDGLADLQEVGRRYEARTGRPALEARQILAETEAALARAALPEAEALQFCARLARLDTDLHHRPRSSFPRGRRR